VVLIVDGRTCGQASRTHQAGEEVALAWTLAFAVVELWSPHHAMVSMAVLAAVHHAGTQKKAKELGVALWRNCFGYLLELGHPSGSEMQRAPQALSGLRASSCLVSVSFVHMQAPSESLQEMVTLADSSVPPLR